MEKKNLTVIVNTADSAASDDEVFGAGVAGEVALYSAEDNQVTASGSITTILMGQGVYFGVQNADGSHTKSDLIMPNNITMMTEQAAVDAVGKVVTISALSNVDCESEYCLKVRYESPVIAQTYGYQDMVKTYSYVTRCCAASCGCPDGAVWDVAMGLAEQLNADAESAMNSTNAKAETIMAALVRNSTTVLTVADYDNTQNWTFTKGSNVIACTTNVHYGASTPTVAGDFVGVIDTGAAGTVAAGNATYFRVEAVDGLNLTLDRPWHLPTVTFAGGGSDLQVLPRATGEAYADSTWSLEVQFADGADADGIVVHSTPGSTDFTKPYVVDGFIGLSCGLDCNATVTTTTEAVQPEGLGYLVNQQSLWARRYESKFGPYLGTTITNQAVSGTDYFATNSTSYSLFHIDYVDTSASAATDSNMPRPKRVTLAITGSTAIGEINAIFDKLNSVFQAPFRNLG